VAELPSDKTPEQEKEAAERGKTSEERRRVRREDE